MAHEFDTALEGARRRRRRRFFGGAIGIAGFLLISAFVYVYMTAFQVIVKPSTISNYSIRTAGGLALGLGTRVLLPVGETTVVVSAAGFVEERKLISADSPAKSITFLLRYSEVDVSFETSAEVTNPNWIVDDLLLSTDTSPTLKLKPGEYRLSLLSDYHLPETKLFSVEPGKPSVVKTKVTPRSVPFKIQTTPSSAQIFIDDAYVGESPWRSQESAGRKKLRIAKEGYVSVEETLDTGVGQKEISRTYRLDRQMREIKASFSPPKGRLFIDGSSHEISSVIKVNSGFDTEVQYELEGYRGQTQIVSEFDTGVSFDLSPMYGQLEISSIPTAEVFIGGQYTGRTPLQLDLLAKQHVITLVTEGYMEKNQKITVREGKNHKLVVQLISQKDYRLSTSRPRITNSIGMAMTRFRPKQMTIGAPRNQKGQRANEHLREVNFSRAIYFGDTEVTRAHYATFQAEQNRTPRVDPTEYPVNSISWQEAVAFCNWLSLREGLTPFYEISDFQVIGFDESSMGYRLPTEAEWEYVARLAGKKNPTVFVWGDEYEIPEKAGNLADYSAKGTVKIYLADYNDGHAEIAPVGSSEPEPSGVYDMSGNVSEWVHDFYSLALPDNKEKNLDYMGAEFGPSHIVKGSNYLSADWTELRASFKETSNDGRIDVGFRIARFIH